MMSAVSTVAAVPSIDIDVFGDEFLTDPVAYYDLLRDAGPVVYLSRYGVYGMARYVGVMAALKDFDAFCSGRGGTMVDYAKAEGWRKPSLLVENDPPQHNSLRKLMDRIVALRNTRRSRVFT